MEFPEVIELNVGGRHFTTSLATLTKYPDSKLTAMFSGTHHVPQDKDGCYSIDVDGDDFAHILKFLRFKKTPPPEKSLDILECAEYFGLKELKTVLSKCMSVKAISLYADVRKNVPYYNNVLENIKCRLFNEPIRSTFVFISFKSFMSCTGKKVDHVFHNEYLNIEVDSLRPNIQEMMVVAAVSIYDLKASGIYPEDETIYKPSPACSCTIRRKIRLGV